MRALIHYQSSYMIRKNISNERWPVCAKTPPRSGQSPLCTGYGAVHLYWAPNDLESVSSLPPMDRRQDRKAFATASAVTSGRDKHGGNSGLRTNARTRCPQSVSRGTRRRLYTPLAPDAPIASYTKFRRCMAFDSAAQCLSRAGAVRIFGIEPRDS